MSLRWVHGVRGCLVLYLAGGLLRDLALTTHACHDHTPTAPKHPSTARNMCMLHVHVVQAVVAYVVRMYRVRARLFATWKGGEAWRQRRPRAVALYLSLSRVGTVRYFRQGHCFNVDTVKPE